MNILLIVILLSFMTGCLSFFKVTGYSGGTVIICCHYSTEERSHEKYFCVGKNSWSLSCEDQIRSVLKNTWVHSGNFSLYDNTGENYFKVIIRQLTRQDEGTYWCGVDKPTLPDSYTKVELDVKEVKSTNTTTTTTATSDPPRATFISLSSSSSSFLNGSGTSVVIMVSVSLVVLLLVISLIIVYRWKYKATGSVSSTHRVERPLQSDSDAATSTIYATANLPTSHSDSLHHDSVNFHKNPSSPNEARVTITKEGSCSNEATAAIAKGGTSSCDYATVNYGQSPTYSTVNHPHSSSEAPPIYSTGSIPIDT
uniref:CMRF35-like molecule 1 n=1 Tax=Salmo trutta TaxID=8032 RepID=A0A674BMF4_SALTR